MSYQAQGLTWWSDYNITLRERGSGCEMDLAAWITLVNQSDASYPDAQLKLVAGVVHRAAVGEARNMGQMSPPPAAMLARNEADTGFQESGLSEYHLYTLGRHTDLPDNSTKQIELFPAVHGVTCGKQLVFTAGPVPWNYGSGPIVDQGFAATNPGTVGSYVEFENNKANHLGIPLPGGRVRVNEANKSDGALEFIGEDIIQHTPRGDGAYPPGRRF